MANPIEITGVPPQSAPAPAAAPTSSWLSAGMGPVVGGGLSLLGGLLGNRSSARAARQQQQWQEHMRATQYQTAVSDLKSAGLNPMLAYTQGGAGTPSGAQAQQRDAISPAVASAASTASAMASVANIQADTQNKESMSAQIEAQTALLLKDAQVRQWDARLRQHQGTTAWAEAEREGKPESIKARIERTLHDTEQARLGLSPARAAASFYDSVGAGAQSAKSLADMAPLFRLLLDAKSSRKGR